MIVNKDILEPHASDELSEKDSVQQKLIPRPPIIIKSGSLIISSDNPIGLVGTTGNSIRPIKQRAAGLPYKLTTIERKNLNTPSEYYQFADSETLTLRIWVQFYDEERDVWNPRDLERQPRFEMTSNTRGELEIYSDGVEEINEYQENSKYQYSYKLRDSDKRNRFGRIQLLDRDFKPLHRPIEAKDDDEFIIRGWKSVRVSTNDRGVFII